MTLGFDTRGIISPEERVQHCLCCDRAIVVLPNDHRGGYCFDCLSFEDSGIEVCPECRTPLLSENRHTFCHICGWSVHHCWRS